MGVLSRQSFGTALMRGGLGFGSGAGDFGPLQHCRERVGAVHGQRLPRSVPPCGNIVAEVAGLGRALGTLQNFGALAAPFGHRGGRVGGDTGRFPKGTPCRFRSVCRRFGRGQRGYGFGAPGPQPIAPGGRAEVIGHPLRVAGAPVGQPVGVVAQGLERTDRKRAIRGGPVFERGSQHRPDVVPLRACRRHRFGRGNRLPFRQARDVRLDRRLFGDQPRDRCARIRQSLRCHVQPRRRRVRGCRQWHRAGREGIGIPRPQRQSHQRRRHHPFRSFRRAHRPIVLGIQRPLGPYRFNDLTRQSRGRRRWGGVHRRRRAIPPPLRRGQIFLGGGRFRRQFRPLGDQPLHCPTHAGGWDGIPSGFGLPRQTEVQERIHHRRTIRRGRLPSCGQIGLGLHRDRPAFGHCVDRIAHRQRGGIARQCRTFTGQAFGGIGLPRPIAGGFSPGGVGGFQPRGGVGGEARDVFQRVQRRPSGIQRREQLGDAADPLQPVVLGREAAGFRLHLRQGGDRSGVRGIGLLPRLGGDGAIVDGTQGLFVEFGRLRQTPLAASVADQGFGFVIQGGQRRAQV